MSHKMGSLWVYLWVYLFVFSGQPLGEEASSVRREEKDSQRTAEIQREAARVGTILAGPGPFSGCSWHVATRGSGQAVVKK